jgi:hypothetical protein
MTYQLQYPTVSTQNTYKRERERKKENSMHIFYLTNGSDEYKKNMLTKTKLSSGIMK